MISLFCGVFVDVVVEDLKLLIGIDREMFRLERRVTQNSQCQQHNLNPLEGLFQWDPNRDRIVASRITVLTKSGQGSLKEKPYLEWLLHMFCTPFLKFLLTRV